MIYTSTLTTNQPNKHSQREPILQKMLHFYWSYVDQQNSQKVYWYMLTIIVIPCVYMVLSILAMAQIVEHYEYSIGFCMILFYINVIVHIGGMKSRIYVPLFHLTTIIFVAVPLISYLIYN